MKKRVVVIHTFLYGVEDIKKVFSEKLPEVDLINIIDDSLLQEALDNKGVTPGIVRRICQYSLQAEAMGADCILNQCSSVSEVVDIAGRMLHIPFVKMDGPMAEEAVALGRNIAVIATAISAIEPTSRLLESVANLINKEVSVNRYYVDGAYEALTFDHDREKHNRLVVDTIKKAAEHNDVIVLAQGSMQKLIPLLTGIDKPVLTSMDSGVQQIRRILNL